MSTRRTASTNEGPRASRRKGRTPVTLYVAIAVVLAAVAVAAVGCSLLRGASRPSDAKPALAGTATSTPSGVATSSAESSASEEPSLTPASSAATSSASAVKDAAVRYPDPPAVTAETIRHATPGRKLVAITLDDGIPFDSRILDLFESRGVRCTTFLLGQAIVAHPDLVKRMNADGFEIADHTWDHKTLTKLSDSEIRSELERTQKRISDITGNQAPYMRPPGGGTSKRVERVAASMGYRVVLWNRSFADTSKAATVDKIYHNVMDGLKPGDIILCHWGGKHNYEALKLILPEMERRGFTPVTLSELLAAEDASQ